MPSTVSTHSEQGSTVFLGHDISKKEITVDSSRIWAVKVWSVLKSDHFILFRVGQSTEVLTVFFY